MKTARRIDSITRLPVDEIEMGQRLRPVSAAGVAALIASIRELGLIKDAIHVRRIKKSGKIVLLAGGHRLTAARQLRDEGDDRFAEIDVIGWECNDAFAQLMEIDDNLAGAELTPLDTAVFLARRKRIYEDLHPETKQQVGAGLVAKRWDTRDTVSLVSFRDAVSEQMGLSAKHVERLAMAGSRLDAKDITALRKAPRHVGTRDLLALSKITDPVTRSDVVERMAGGGAKNAADALRQVKAARGEGPVPRSDFDEKLHRLRDAWSRATPKVRRAFLEEHGAEVAAVLEGVQ